MQNMLFERKINAIFEAWKAKANHHPIIVKGCRQCGKTYSVRKFANEHYKYVVYIDFFKHPELKAIFENLLADIFGKMGRKLYYYHKNEGVELDFLMRYRGACVPVECKAVNGNAKSMKTVLGHPEKYHVASAFKIGDYNIGRAGAVLTIPHYMAFLLREV